MVSLAAQLRPVCGDNMIGSLLISPCPGLRRNRKPVPGGHRRLEGPWWEFQVFVSWNKECVDSGRYQIGLLQKEGNF